MRFFYPCEPQGQERPRLGKWGIYSKQSAIQRMEKFWFIHAMRQKGYLKPLESPIVASLTFRHSIPKSWSQKRRNAAVGASYSGAPDIDNCLKYYFDVLNGVAYADDRLISAVWANQIYSTTPGVEIQLHSLGGHMIKEHAKTVKREILLEDVNGMVKKANTMGIAGRNITQVLCEEDGEDKHYYFEAQAQKLPDAIPQC